MNYSQQKVVIMVDTLVTNQWKPSFEIITYVITLFDVRIKVGHAKFKTTGISPKKRH